MVVLDLTATEDSCLDHASRSRTTLCGVEMIYLFRVLLKMPSASAFFVWHMVFFFVFVCIDWEAM